MVRLLQAALRGGAIFHILSRKKAARLFPLPDLSAIAHYGPVNRCIYCGENNPDRLTREHIAPYALGGNAELLKASCLPCAAATKRFEEDCADQIFHSLRVLHNVHSRRPLDTELSLYLGDPKKGDPVLGDPNREDPLKVLVPATDHPGLLLMPSFDPPGIVMGRPPTVGSGLGYHVWKIGEDQEGRFQRMRDAGLDVSSVQHGFTLRPFLQLLAKIAHCVAVADYGVNGFRHELIEIIQKGDDSAPYYIGGSVERRAPPEAGRTHWVRPEIRHIHGKNYVVVFFRLIAYLGTPIYSVVVGEVIPSWRTWWRP